MSSLAADPLFQLNAVLWMLQPLPDKQDALRPVLVPLLLFLGFMKFILVVLWYMHLKFDSKLFRRLFATGLVVAVTVFSIVLVWFLALGGPAPAVGG
jgi:heme/copper-type cytochrome/quinol oxidase subunit 4